VASYRKTDAGQSSLEPPDAHTSAIEGDPRIIAFATMIRALDQADYRLATRMRRELSARGWSCFPTAGSPARRKPR
jgi:hypothetical protein